jgi:pimeloyl-ACP methyl ester carboxylesterase
MTPHSSPLLVLLPGMACDHAVWRHQRPALATVGAVVVADTHLEPEADSLPQMAERLLAGHPGRLALAGCSMGAMLALHAWRLAPDRIAGLALLGTTARPDSAEMKALRTEAIGLFEQGRMAEVLRANALFAFHPAHAARLLHDYLAMVQRGGAAGLIRQNRAVMARDDLRPMLPDIRCPTLVMGGLDDALTPPDCAREIADAVPGATLQLLFDCGHMLTWEQPERVTQALLAWRLALA